jgi:hypothetical protein
MLAAFAGIGVFVLVVGLLRAIQDLRKPPEE